MRFYTPASRTAVACLAFILLGTTGGGDAIATPPPPCHEIEITYQGREYAYKKQGVTYYRWYYTVTADSCITRAVSHWTIEFCGDWVNFVSAVSTRSVDASDLDGGDTAIYNYEIGYDPTTGLTGLKWEHAGGNELDRVGEYDRFSFICPGTATSESPLEWASKGGQLVDGGKVVGPGCFPPVSTDKITWGRLKALMR